MSSVIVRFKGELGEAIELSIPDLPAGEKFDRWGKAIARIKSNGFNLSNEFGIEYSDIQHFLGQLIKVRPNKSIDWETMEGDVKLEFKASALGNIDMLAVFSSSKSFCRSATFRMPITIQQVELAISQLERILLPKDKNYEGR